MPTMAERSAAVLIHCRHTIVDWHNELLGRGYLHAITDCEYQEARPDWELHLLQCRHDDNLIHHLLSIGTNMNLWNDTGKTPLLGGRCRR